MHANYSKDKEKKVDVNGSFVGNTPVLRIETKYVSFGGEGAYKKYLCSIALQKCFVSLYISLACLVAIRSSLSIFVIFAGCIRFEFSLLEN